MLLLPPICVGKTALFADAAVVPFGSDTDAHSLGDTLAPRRLDRWIAVPPVADLTPRITWLR